MTRYFFHSANGTRHLDNEGMVLPSLDAARQEAIRWMGELLTELPDDLWSAGKFAIFVTDADWRLFFSVTTICAEVPGAAEMIERSRRKLDAPQSTG